MSQRMWPILDKQIKREEAAGDNGCRFPCGVNLKEGLGNNLYRMTCRKAQKTLLGDSLKDDLKDDRKPDSEGDLDVVRSEQRELKTTCSCRYQNSYPWIPTC